MAPRKQRKITAAAVGLKPDFGDVVSIRLPRQSKKSVMFIKRKPDLIVNWQSTICTFERYRERFECALHSSISNNMKSTLISQGHVAEDFFE